MINLYNCPSSLASGYDTYSPKSLKVLFDGLKVSHILDFKVDGSANMGEVAVAMQRISVSGVQEKFPAVIENGKIRMSRQGTD